MKTLQEKAKAFYVRYQRVFEVVSFAIGWGVDGVTLRRIDNVEDNLLLSAHLLGLYAVTVVLHRIEARPEKSGWLRKRVAWLHFAAQFLAGGLLSAYSVFFFRSAYGPLTLIFPAVIVAAMIVNDFVFDWEERQKTRIWGLWFVTTCYCLCFVPVLTGRLDQAIYGWCFLLSLSVSTLAAVAFDNSEGDGPLGRAKRWFVQFGGATAALILVSWMQLMPPVPLAVLDSALVFDYDKSEHAGQEEVVGWPFRRPAPTIHVQPGEKLYFVSAVFAPRETQFTIFHTWSYYDEQTGEWTEPERLPANGMTVSGGRDGGWRGYSNKSRTRPGTWHVRVLGPNDRVLESVTFEIAEGERGRVRTRQIR